MATVLACALALAGCQVRFGNPVALIEDRPALEKALEVVRAHFSGPVRILKVSIARDEATIQTEDPRDATRVAQWRLSRARLAFLSWDQVSGPSRIDPVLINPRLAENLFDLKQLDVAALEGIGKAALARAGIGGAVRVERMEIARPPIILPAPASGDVRWTVEVRSDRENARVFMDPAGRVVGADLSGTQRAKTLDMIRQPELAADAAKAVRAHLGSKPVLLKVSFSASSISFETTLPDDRFPFNTPGGLRGAATYVWSLNGLQQTMGRADTRLSFSNPDQPFGVDDLDWSLLPKMVEEARERIAMPKGRITTIELSKPGSGVAGPALRWRIDIDEGRERGTATFDTAGGLKTLLLPQSRRAPVDWLKPESAADALAQIRREFGENARIVQILIHDRQISITAEDPSQPGQTMQVLLNGDGFMRFGTAWQSGVRGAFTMNDVKSLSADALSEFISRTLTELKMPPGAVSRITIGRGTIQSTPDNSVKIELRVDARGVGSGWGVYELDGRVVRYMRP
jgi:hypothetical protein